MKKLLGSTLTLAMLFPSSQASAALFKDLKFMGQLDLQATSARNVSDFVTRGDAAQPNNDRLGDAQTRLMLTGMFDLLDDVHATVTVTKNDRTYGTNGGNPQVSARSQALITGGGTGVANNVFVDQANVKIDKLVGDVDVTLGRQFFGESGDLIIYFGPSDAAWYGLPTNSLDAARFDWMSGDHSVTGVVAKIQGTAAGTVPQPDTDLRGISAMCKGENHKVGAYVYNVVRHRTGPLGAPPTDTSDDGGKNDNLYIVGVKGKVEAGPAFVKAEIAKNFGTNRVGVDYASTGDHGARTYKGHALMVKGGANLEMGGVGKVKPWGKFAYGSGRKDLRSNSNEDFQSVNSDFRPGVIYGRFAQGGALALGGAVTALSQPGVANRVIYGVGVMVTPEAVEKLTVGASAHSFNTQTNATPTPESGQAVFGGNKHIGNEYAVQAMWKHSENVEATLAAATFQPGGLIRAIRNASNDHRNNPALMGSADLRIKFGGSK